MAYRFKKDEGIPQAVRRVYAEELSWAVGQLTKSKKRAQAIHETRKSIKKIRGLLSLLGSSDRQQDRYFRDAGRLLSEERDNAVMLQVFDQLAAQHPQLDAATVKEIHNALQRAERRVRVTNGAAVELLKQAPAVVCGELSPETLGNAMEKTYRRGRKALKRAQKEHNAEGLHDFRKQVKQHWYHLRLMAGDGTEKRQGALDELATVLGDENNLSVLRERLKSEAETTRDRLQTKEFIALIDQEMQALRARVLAAGEKLYAEKSMPVSGRRPVSTAPPPARSAVA